MKHKKVPVKKFTGTQRSKMLNLPIDYQLE